MRQAAAIFMAAAALSAGDLARGDAVVRRTREGTITGTIVTIDDAGVTVRSSEFGTEYLITWDRVADVHMDRQPADLPQRLKDATELWRARSRVQRGDCALAEPLLEKWFRKLPGATHETALIVAEGLLRCRLDRMEHALAVIPALEAARLRRASIATKAYEKLHPVLDEGTLLCPSLAPAWVDSATLARLENELAAYDARGDEVIAALAGLYLQAVRHARGTNTGEVAAATSAVDHPGVNLLASIVQAAAGEASARAEARRDLERQVDSLPPWAEAWARFQLGAALANEGESLEARQRGMVNLLHLPARFARTQPYLAGLALERAAGALERLGQAEPAASLRAELAAAFPGHPILAVGSQRPSTNDFKETG
jgi:hypothetical protein